MAQNFLDLRLRLDAMLMIALCLSIFIIGSNAASLSLTSGVPLPAGQLETLLKNAEKGNLPPIRELLKKASRQQLVNESTWQQLGDGDTPLHRAARSDQLAAFKMLYAALSELLYAKNNANMTVIHEAVIANSTQVADYLLAERPALIEAREGTYNRTPIYLAAEFGNLFMVRSLANRDANLFAKSSESYGEAMPIHEAARWDHADIVAFLHGRGCSLGLREGYYGRIPLHEAAINGSVKLVQMLVERGSDAFAKSDLKKDMSYTPMHWATAMGHIEVVKYLINYDPTLLDETDRDGDRPIHVAVLNNRTQLVEFFLALGTEVTARQESFGRTLLHQATSKGLIHLMKRFIALGADPYDRSNSFDCESMPIHLAARHGRLDAVRMLISQYEDMLWAKDGCGRTLVQLIKMSDKLGPDTFDLIRLLQEKGVHN